MASDQEPGEAAAIAPEQLGYEAALESLDGVLNRLEDGQVALEEAIQLYERGVALVKRCSGLLDAAERRVTELGLGPDGLPRERPMAAEGGDDEAASAAS